MFFSASKVKKACSGNLDDPGHFTRVYEDLVGNAPVVADFDHMLLDFLKSLPSATNQQKILNRLRKMARAHGAAIREFRWWDIMKSERILFATLTRDGRNLTVSFVWKKTVKGETTPPVSHGQLTWMKDSEALYGWRVEFGASSYQDVKALFEKWLSEPLPPFP